MKDDWPESLSLVGAISKRAGLRRSNEMTSLRPLTRTVKCFLSRCNTLYGPLYGRWRGLRTASYLTKT